jgi:hypothetical protein
VARLSKLKTCFKPIEIQADAPNISSDGGVLALRKLDKQYGLTSRAAVCLSDPRKECKHTVEKMVAQRVYGIALGWEDCNDFDKLRSDPVYGLALESSLASQPMLSRFENWITSKDLYRLSHVLLDVFAERHKKSSPKWIVLDIDSTVDPCHGQQELNLFNGFYDCRCYCPLLVFGSCDSGPMEILAAVLRPGNSQSCRNAAAILGRIIKQLRKSFPKSKILVRADAGFAWPEFYGMCEQMKVKYLVATEGYKKLKEEVEPLMIQSRGLRDQTSQASRCYGELSYKAHKWSECRRVIVKAEALADKEIDGKSKRTKPKTGKEKDRRDNARFVVTNLKGDPETLYAIYCLRGESENRIKEMKLDMASGRTSCTKFEANALRLMFHALAFALMSLLRDSLSGTDLARCTMGQIRLKLLKVATIVQESTRRIVIRLPRGHPHADLLMQLIQA